MPVDSRIALGLQSAAPSVDEIYNMGKMIRERRLGRQQDADNEAVRKSKAAGVKIGPGGKVIVDNDAELAALGESAPHLVGARQGEIVQADQAARKAKLEQHMGHVNMMGQLSGSVVDQPTYDRFRSESVKLGLLDEDKIPPQYNPEYIKGVQNQAISAKERVGFELQQLGHDLNVKKEENSERARSFDQGMKSKEFALNKEKFELEKQSAPAEPKMGLTEGEKAVDKDWAKDYNDWTSGGEKSARAEIAKLDGVISKLEKGEVTTGGLTGMFGDRLTSDSLLGVRSDVNSTVMKSLKALMGNAFTEKEGDRVIKNTWNEADSTANNVARLKRLAQDLLAQADDKNTKSKHFEQNRTLKGFQPISSGGGEQVAQAPKTFKTTEIEWAD